MFLNFFAVVNSFSIACTGMSVHEGVQKVPGGMGGEVRGAQLEKQWSREQPQSQTHLGWGREEATKALFCLAAGCVLAALRLGIHLDRAALSEASRHLHATKGLNRGDTFLPQDPKKSHCCLLYQAQASPCPC